MSIYYKDEKYDLLNLIYSKDIFKVALKIRELNKGSIFLSPFTRLDELIKINKNNIVVKPMYEKFLERMNLKLESELLKFYSHNIESEYDQIHYQYDVEKIFKSFIIINNRYINLEDVKSFIMANEEAGLKKLDIVIFGFEDMEKIVNDWSYVFTNVVFIVDKLKKFDLQQIGNILTIDRLEFIRIIDYNIFVQWLALKIKDEIFEEDIQNYLNDNMDQKSLKISKILG